MESIYIYIFVVSFVATLVRSTFGFGESLIAVPLFILFYSAGDCRSAFCFDFNFGCLGCRCSGSSANSF